MHSVVGYAPLGGWQYARNDPQKRRLPSAVRPSEAEYDTGVQCQIYRLDPADNSAACRMVTSRFGSPAKMMEMADAAEC